MVPKSQKCPKNWVLRHEDLGSKSRRGREAYLFVNKLIHRKGRIHQSMNARRQKVENQIREEELESIRYKSRDRVLAHKPDMDTIHKIAYPAIDSIRKLLASVWM